MSLTAEAMSPVSLQSGWPEGQVKVARYETGLSDATIES